MLVELYADGRYHVSTGRTFLLSVIATVDSYVFVGVFFSVRMITHEPLHLAR